MTRNSLNQGHAASTAAKKDEFYTQYIDIQKEVEAYLEFDPNTFRDKVVYCNCDDPFESNFFKYFAANFNYLGLKRLVTTSYDGSPIAGQLTLFPEYNEGNDKRQKPKAVAVILDHVKDEDGDGAAKATLEPVAKAALEKETLPEPEPALNTSLSWAFFATSTRRKLNEAGLTAGSAGAES